MNSLATTAANQIIHLAPCVPVTRVRAVNTVRIGCALKAVRFDPDRVSMHGTYDVHGKHVASVKNTTGAC